MDDIRTTSTGGLTSEKGSWGATTTIILLLLGVIVAVMSYNYWMMYRLQKNNLTNEPFDSNQGASDLSSGASNESPDNTEEKTCVNGSDGVVCPTVRSVLEQVSHYEEGSVSEKLKQHIVDQNTSVQVQNQQPSVQTTQRQGQVPTRTPVQNQNPNISQRQAPVSNTVTTTNTVTAQQTASQKTQKTSERPKSETPESGVFKVIFYHASWCGHCKAIMNRNRPDEKSQYEKLNDIFSDDDTVVILDFQHGRDEEASRVQSFPTIMFVTESGAEEYRGNRDAVSIAKAVIDKKN
ncbi:Protein disulfide-isomerase [Yasminevirus sp. GU-2018]|uniref:Protein disulfide-isomerase n=1 Tax=Yasminevirus sp. GU-2018 TaxID=2420051 RepID=A0A5K0U831_9VIRU|nr:Protein disulfide-isomerase [Yasminevirus sp. GU-2018]